MGILIVREFPIVALHHAGCKIFIDSLLRRYPVSLLELSSVDGLGFCFRDWVEANILLSLTELLLVAECSLIPVSEKKVIIESIPFSFITQLDDL